MKKKAKKRRWRCVDDAANVWLAKNENIHIETHNRINNSKISGNSIRSVLSRHVVFFSFAQASVCYHFFLQKQNIRLIGKAIVERIIWPYYHPHSSSLAAAMPDAFPLVWKFSWKSKETRLEKSTVPAYSQRAKTERDM